MRSRGDVRTDVTVSTLEAVLVHLSQSSPAFVYLVRAIRSARSLEELARMDGLARVHYSGVLLSELEAQIDAQHRVLAESAPRLDVG